MTYKSKKTTLKLAHSNPAFLQKADGWSMTTPFLLENLTGVSLTHYYTTFEIEQMSWEVNASFQQMCDSRQELGARETNKITCISVRGEPTLEGLPTVCGLWTMQSYLVALDEIFEELNNGFRGAS